MKEEKLVNIIRKLSKRFGVPPPSLWLEDEMPYEEVGAGMYLPDRKEILLELYDPEYKEKYSDKFLLNCLAHEFVHHLEYTKLGIFPLHGGKFALMVIRVEKMIKGFLDD
jgi:predicted SprT family Zn-dependent metalloprotease